MRPVLLALLIACGGRQPAEPMPSIVDPVVVPVAVVSDAALPQTPEQKLVGELEAFHAEVEALATAVTATLAAADAATTAEARNPVRDTIVRQMEQITALHPRRAALVERARELATTATRMAWEQSEGDRVTLDDLEFKLGANLTAITNAQMQADRDDARARLKQLQDEVAKDKARKAGKRP